MKSSYTRDLLRAQKEGAKIVIRSGPYADHEVAYDPGHARSHPRPWILPATGYRYSGSELKAIGKHGGPWALARLLRLSE